MRPCPRLPGYPVRGWLRTRPQECGPPSRIALIVTIVDACVARGLTQIDRTHQPADRVSKALLRRHPQLDNAGRARVSRALHGVQCHRRALTWLLTQAGLPHSPMLLWLAYRVHVLGEAATEMCESLEVPGLQPGLQGMLSPRWPSQPVLRLATQRSLPIWIARAWLEQYGRDDADALAAALNEAGPVTLRAAPISAGPQALSRYLMDISVPSRPGRWAPQALHTLKRFDIRGNAAWLAGHFEVQDEGSQLIAAAVQAQPGQVVIDLCAGSGGKTLALASDMRDQGTLHACDISKDRLGDLRGRVRRRELSSVQVHLLPHSAPDGGADRVLVDAPCSATGTWRRGPDRRWHTLAAEIPQLAALQLRLLGQGADLVGQGGRLVYATCSLLAQENQEVARRFLKARPEWRAVPCLPQVFGDETQVELRPDIHGTDGFFIAAFARP